MAKSYEQADRGNFRAFKNISKEPGDDRPLFQGKLTLPNSKEERSFSLWPYASKKDGATILSGRAGVSANSQIAAYTQPTKEEVQRITIELPATEGKEPSYVKPDSLSLFTNKTKDAANPDRPDFYGHYNPGDGVLMRISAWSQLDRNGNPMLTGSIERYDRNNAREQDAAGPPPPQTEHAREPEPEHAR